MNPHGRYRLGRLIKRGSQAEIWEAELALGSGFGRRVALKRALPNADPAMAQSFLDEAKLASQLHHANIVPVIDMGELDGLPFQVQDLVEGLDLASILSAGPLPAEIALHITAVIGDALAYAHRAKDPRGVPLGIVHRDVTPENVLVSWEGDVKLADFGNAFAWKRVVSTEVGIVKGKLEYMSPEQARAETVTPLTDIFALGCLLYRQIAGKSPLFKLTIEQIAAGAIPDLDPNLPADVTRIVRRAIHPAMAERYKTAEDLGADCTALLAGRGIHDPRAKLRAKMASLRAERTKEEPARGGLGGSEPNAQNAPVVRPKTAIYSEEPSATLTGNEPTELAEISAPEVAPNSQLTERSWSMEERMEELMDRTPILAPKILPPPGAGKTVRVAYARPQQRRLYILGFALIVAFAALLAMELYPQQKPLIIETINLERPAAIPHPRTEDASRQDSLTLDPVTLRPQPLRRAPRVKEEPKTETNPPQQISPEVVESKLKQLSTRLEDASKRMTPKRIEDLEREYFEIRSRFHADLSDPECRALLFRIASLEEKIGAGR